MPLPSPIDGSKLPLELEKEGLLPRECVSVNLVMDAGGVMQLHYIVNVTEEDLPKVHRAIGRVLTDLGIDW